MAITTNYEQIKQKYDIRIWESINEYEIFYLREISERSADTNYYTNKNGDEIIIKPINHHPELKKYEVWMEGYVATGEKGIANLQGITKARNFAQACHIVMCENKLKHIKEENNSEYKDYSTPGRWDYNPQMLSFWGCRLFWSKQLASKLFG